jgi:glutamate/tyrosine decarboxylase-like PLP-dependent enzyme
MSDALMLPPEARLDLWRRLGEAVEGYARGVETLPVAPQVTSEELRGLLGGWDFSAPVDWQEALDFAVDGLSRHQVHTPHPRYYGLFNPAPTTMGIAADALAAAFNPQLAAWSHNPFAVEVEQHLVRALGGRFGYDPARCEGCFTSGGAEANHTALLVALQRAFPEVGRRGLQALRSQPVLYVSPQAHHSFQKAARMSGLGADAVHEVAVDGRSRMRAESLDARIREDRAAGRAPFLVVATAGSTGAGVIDPIAPLAEVSERFGLWLHVDAAWGGAAVLLPELRQQLAGVERAGSITFDAHKWLSVPMGAGLYLTRHPGVLDRTFRVATGYMPPGQASAVDPYAQSMQWSRRFIGLKLFLSLAVAGWPGYEEAIRHQVAMGDRLRRALTADGWTVVNDTPLPLVCFVRDTGEGGVGGVGGAVGAVGAAGAAGAAEAAARLESIAAAVVASGQAWISTVHLEAGTALRACITNHRTGAADVEALVEALGSAWRKAAIGLP